MEYLKNPDLELIEKEDKINHAGRPVKNLKLNYVSVDDNKLMQ